MSSRSRTIRRPEQQIQRAVFQHLKARGAKGLVVWHTPNGGRRKPIEAAILKGIGVRAGVSDVIAVHQGKIYAMEIKAPGGRASEDQLKFLSDMDAAGAFTALPEGLDASLRTLESWGLLKGTTA